MSQRGQRTMPSLVHVGICATKTGVHRTLRVETLRNFKVGDRTTRLRNPDFCIVPNAVMSRTRRFWILCPRTSDFLLRECRVFLHRPWRNAPPLSHPLSDSTIYSNGDGDGDDNDDGVSSLCPKKSKSSTACISEDQTTRKVSPLSLNEWANAQLQAATCCRQCSRLTAVEVAIRRVVASVNGESKSHGCFPDPLVSIIGRYMTCHACFRQRNIEEFACSTLAPHVRAWRQSHASASCDGASPQPHAPAGSSLPPPVFLNTPQPVGVLYECWKQKFDHDPCGHIFESSWNIWGDGVDSRDDRVLAEYSSRCVAIVRYYGCGTRDRDMTATDVDQVEDNSTLYANRMRVNWDVEQHMPLAPTCATVPMCAKAHMRDRQFVAAARVERVWMAAQERLAKDAKRRQLHLGALQQLQTLYALNADCRDSERVDDTSNPVGTSVAHPCAPWTHHLREALHLLERAEREFLFEQSEARRKEDAAHPDVRRFSELERASEGERLQQALAIREFGERDTFKAAFLARH